MNRVFVALTSVVALALGGLALAPAQADTAKPSASGTVMVSGQGLDGAQVHFDRDMSGTVEIAYADSYGQYATNTELAAGSYLVSVSAGWNPPLSFVTTYYGNTVRRPDATKVTFKVNDARTLNIAAQPAGRITGTVRSARGGPAAGAYVTASALNRSGSGSAITDRNGRYSISQLPSDTYLVSAATSRAGYMPAFKITHTKVRAGSTSTAKTLTLGGRKAGSSTITGRVIGARGVSTYASAVSVVSLSGNSYGGGYGDAQGEVIITDLQAGTYRVFLNGANTSKVIKVAKGKSKSFGTMKRAKGTRIAGVVKTASGQRMPEVSVSANDANGTLLGTGMTNSTGTYSIPGATNGKYTVYVVSNDAKNLAPKGRTVIAKSDKEIRADFTMVRPATIKGKVVNAKGHGVAGMRVSASIKSGARGGGSYESAVTNEKGYYSIQGMAAGKARLSAIDPYAGGYFNGYYKATSSAKSKTVPTRVGKTTRAVAIRVH